MLVLINNNNTRYIDASNYDKVIHIGIIPNKQLADNELIVDRDNHFLIGKTIISMRGMLKNNNPAPTKKHLESIPLDIDQVCLNDSNTNFSNTLDNGRTIHYIGIGNHMELDL